MANKTDTLDNTLISPYSKIKVYWDDQPHNYSKEAKNKIRNYIANKYGVQKNNITVVYRPVRFNTDGDAIEITGAGMENIMDVNYQRALMKELITRDGKNVDFNRIVALDDKVNGELNVDLTQTTHRSWSIKWLMIDNFLSFGESNYVPFSKLKGLTIVNSIPANQGGKCVRSDTRINIQFDKEEIGKKIGVLPDEITIGELNSIYEKYGDLGFKVNTPYGYKDITWCGITEENADVYRCELEDGKYVEGADYHRLKKEDGEFVVLKEVEVGERIQTVNGISNVKSIKLMDFKDTLYDIQVDEVHQYYSNGIVSHNTTLTIDAIKFLLHGNTTKTDTNEQIFNTYSNKNELVVRGMIEIEGEETIIERKMRRTAKKDGGWTVTNRVNYYRILPDGEEEALNEEDATQTTRRLKETIGSEKDFEMLVLATEKNLDDLIGLTTTESGKILTRLIGLEILELKEKAAREMYNEFARKKKSNEYDVITLGEEIDDHNDKIILGEELDVELKQKLGNTKSEIQTLTDSKDDLIDSKEKIDVTISELNPEKLESEVDKLIDKGVEFKEKVAGLKVKITAIGEIDFDEDKHLEFSKDFNVNTTNKALKEAEITRLEKVVTGLIAGGVCQSCNRKLDDVDNSLHITKHELEIENLRKEVLGVDETLNSLSAKLTTLNENKLLIDNKNKLELNVDRMEVEMGSLRNDVIAKKNDLKKYQLNLHAIEFNKKIEIKVIDVKTKLAVCEYSKDQTIINIQRVQADIQTNKTSVITKTKLIETIKKEEEVDKIFKIYIELVGKKGISKLVLRSVLPIINSEAQRLLEDVVDFDIEISMNDKNDVQFLMVKDGISKLLKSGSGLEKTAASLALRAVLGKLSTLPMPNFITFDEVLGKVASENLEKLKNLFDKIKDMYEIVFFITHNDLVKDWSNNIITVIKKDNLSSISVK